MTTDFVTWFFTRHCWLALCLFPELGLAWGLWMRWWGYALYAGAIITLRRSWPLIKIVWKKIILDK